jgi:Type IV secretory system Conjugative DNA transfer/YWFCY protein
MDNKRPLQFLAGLCCAGVMALHAYYYLYAAFVELKLTSDIADRFAHNFAPFLFNFRLESKLIILFFLAVTSYDSVKSDLLPSWRSLLRRLVLGLVFYFGNDLVLLFTGDPVVLAACYLSAMITGIFVLSSFFGSLIALVTASFRNDIWNNYNESFPQQEQKVRHQLSLHLRGRYRYRNQNRSCWINLVDIMRGTLVMGKPGSGKTRYIFRPLIRQSLERGMAVFVYDLKYDDLTCLTWQALQRFKGKGKMPVFYAMNFDDFSRSHRCNPLDPSGMKDISDAAEAARTILLALNKDWIHRRGEFFVESAVNFVTANIWFLRCYENGRYCTLPHLIELIQTEYDRLFSILPSYPEIESLVKSFVSAYKHGTMEQLQGQIDSARVPLNALVSPKLYYLLSANDFSLDINNADDPKVICIASNPEKENIYGAVVSLVISRMLKVVNRKGGIPCHLFFDEFPSITVLGMDKTLATARSNQVAVTLGIQDLSQLRDSYGRNTADAIFNLPGSLISGHVTGDSAQVVSELFGKILQDKSTYSSNSRDSTVSETQHLDLALPASKISKLSSGEFVGVIGDSPAYPLRLKAFHAQILPDAVDEELGDLDSGPIPAIRNISEKDVMDNFVQIKAQVRELVENRIDYMANTPDLAHLIISRQGPGQNRGLKP